jgi:hypothetical protein
MSRARRRRHDRGNKDTGCAFCGHHGNRSAEHVWPRWVRKYVDLTDAVRYENPAGIERISATSYRATPTTNEAKTGSVLTMRTREVCRICNNGWMSALETNTEQTFGTLWRAIDDGLSLSLQPDSCTSLAAWATKTSWTRELAISRSTATTPAMRGFLRKHGSPPPLTQVWLGRHRGEDLILRQGTFTFAHRDAPFGTNDARRALWTVIALRGVALLAYSVNGDGVPTPARDSSKWTRIWPFDADPAFPPSRVMDDAEVRFEASYHGKGVGFARDSVFQPVIRQTLSEVDRR